ncbi:MAG: tRNA (N6-isopentenyl adenosine(37)-C2)-methylthiotransferase MiaB [Armatimonadetes bacterium]|nr:tRNA (N6-isopentenyl adenosine(37)-C2)-methylthiotransferase MiaB [Armatimonadota bacterium]
MTQLKENLIQIDFSPSVRELTRLDLEADGEAGAFALADAPRPQSYHIITYGCQFNVSDSERIEAQLKEQGMSAASDEASAELVLINTCSVRANPENKVLSKLGELRLLKQDRPDLVVGVCGCMAQREGEALLKQAPVIDLLVGTANVPRVSELAQKVRATRSRQVALEIPTTRTEALAFERGGTRVGTMGKLKSFLPIIEGCDKFCAFCIVPKTRGRERSRPMEEIVRDVERLAANGCKEVTLLGQTVNAYGMIEDGGHRKSAPHFAYLLERLNNVEGIERIRFTSSHPADFRDEMINAIARLPKVCEWIHLPFQAGDNEVLRRMGRGYTREAYIALVQKIRERIPNVVLTTDIMVGFPGETDAQHEKTAELVEELRFDSAYMFAYSPRPDTPAAVLGEQVPRAVKKARLNQIIAMQNAITCEINAAAVGSEVEVLVEGPSQKNPKLMTGLTRGNKTVNFTGPEALRGQFARVSVTEGHLWGFMGEWTGRVSLSSFEAERKGAAA